MQPENAVAASANEAISAGIDIGPQEPPRFDPENINVPSSTTRWRWTVRVLRALIASAAATVNLIVAAAVVYEHLTSLLQVTTVFTSIQISSTIATATLLLGYAVSDFTGFRRGARTWFRQVGTSRGTFTRLVLNFVVWLAFVLAVLTDVGSIEVQNPIQLTMVTASWAAVLVLAIYAITDLQSHIALTDTPHGLVRNRLELTKAGDETTREVVSRLRARALRLNAFSFIILALIGIVLVLGFRLFTAAEQTANQTINLPLLRDSLAKNVGELEKAKVLASAAEKRPDVKAEEIAELMARAKSLDMTVEGIKEEIAKAQQTSSATTTIDPWRFALSLLSTKIGAVALLIFGVQILIGLYRYNAKLASFYESRADLLQLLPSTAIENTDVLRATLVPVDVEFDKQRSSQLTTRDVVRALRDIVGTVKSKPTES